MRPYLLEEAHEVIEAVDAAPLAPAGLDETLEGELGDLLFNVLMMVQIAQDEGRVSFDGVLEQIVAKMIRRHPHVFPPEGGPSDPVAEPSLARWEAVKATERGGGSRLDGIPKGAPALSRAHRQGQKAAGVGFDWPDVDGVFSKVDEELAELREAVAGADRGHIEWELGDVLLALTSLGRHVKTPAEDALRGAIGRFDARFRAMEAQAAESGTALEHLSAEQLEVLWERAKRALAGGEGNL
jgi:MazG family protein